MSSQALDVSVTTRYIDDQSAPDGAVTVLYVLRDDQKYRASRRPADRPSLDHYGRQQPCGGNSRTGRCGPAALVEAREEFEYTSGTALSTPQGSMQGEFLCVTEKGEQFQVKIPEFVLSLPRTLH